MRAAVGMDQLYQYGEIGDIRANELGDIQFTEENDVSLDEFV